MRHVYLSVSDDQRPEIVSILHKHDLDFVSIVNDFGQTLFLFPIPTEAVSPLLDELRNRGIEADAYTVLTKAEFVDTDSYEAVRQQYTSVASNLSQAEFHAKTREIQWPYQTYYLGTVLSVIAAAAGLLSDSPALIIGAMVIAPQVSSALSASTGALLADWELFIDSVRRQTFGLGLAILCAGVFGWFVHWAGFVPTSTAVTQIELLKLRLAPTFLSTVGAIVAGIVGAFGFTTEQSMSLVGVMIAAALIPAAAAVGIGIAWTTPLFAVGAFLLLLVNILAINIGAFITLLILGYHPTWTGRDHSFRGTIDRRTVVYGTIILILFASVCATYATASTVLFQQNTNNAVDETLTQPTYRHITVTTVQSEYQGPAQVFGPINVTVQLIKPSTQSYPHLAARLEHRIEQRTGRAVLVEVQFTGSSTANSQRSRKTSRWKTHTTQQKSRVAGYEFSPSID